MFAQVIGDCSNSGDIECGRRGVNATSMDQ